MYIPFQSAAQVLEALTNPTDAEAPLSWLLCVPDSHAEDLPSLLGLCREAGIRVCGGIFPGIIHGDSVKDSGLIALPLPQGSHVIAGDLTETGVTWKGELPRVSENPLFSSILLVDCLAANVSSLMEDLFDRYSNLISHFGAGTGYRDLRRAPTLFTEDGMQGEAALMALIPKRTTISVRHGWTRVTGPFVASRTNGNVIQELNWEPAGNFYRQEVIKQSPEYAARPIFPDTSAVFPLCIAKEGGEDVIRDPFGLTDADEILMLSDVTENSVMYLAHGDQQSLIAAARQAVQDCGTPNDVEHCFVCDCYSRTVILGERFSEELETVQSELRRFSDVTPEGVLALGEVASHRRQFLELYNKTIVVALTHR